MAFLGQRQPVRLAYRALLFTDVLQAPSQAGYLPIVDFPEISAYIAQSTALVSSLVNFGLLWRLRHNPFQRRGHRSGFLRDLRHCQSRRHDRTHLVAGGRMDTLQCSIGLTKLELFTWRFNSHRDLPALQRSN